MDSLHLGCRIFLVSFFPSFHFGCIVALVQVDGSLFCSFRSTSSPFLASMLVSHRDHVLDYLKSNEYDVPISYVYLF